MRAAPVFPSMVPRVRALFTDVSKGLLWCNTAPFPREEGLLRHALLYAVSKTAIRTVTNHDCFILASKCHSIDATRCGNSLAAIPSFDQRHKSCGIDSTSSELSVVEDVLVSHRHCSNPYPSHPNIQEYLKCPCTTLS